MVEHPGIDAAARKIRRRCGFAFAIWLMRGLVFGYMRMWVLLRREEWPVNRKRVHRLHRLDGLQLRMPARRRKHMALHRGPAPIPVKPTERWSMDFVHDTLADGRPFRILTVVDHWSRHCSVLEAGFRMTRETVGQVLDHGGSWGQNSNREHWRIGPFGEASNATSFAPASPWKTPLLNRLTGGSMTRA